MYFDFDDEEKDYLEYDISSIFGRLPKNAQEAEKKEYDPDTPATADEFRAALNIMAGGEDIFASSSMDEIWALSKVLKEFDEEEELSQEDIEKEEEAGKMAFEDIMKRMRALEALRELDGMDDIKE